MADPAMVEMAPSSSPLKTESNKAAPCSRDLLDFYLPFRRLLYYL